MNASVLLVLCLAGPMVVDQPHESIAVVDLRECLPHVPTSKSDRDAIMHSITDTDAEAKNRHEVITKADAKSKLEGATALEVADARILKLEFDEFRRREQARLQKAEQDMFRKWHKQVDAAVKIVAKRDGFTIILYVGQDDGDTEMAAAEPKQMLTRTHAAYVVHNSAPTLRKGWWQRCLRMRFWRLSKKPQRANGRSKGSGVFD